MGEAKLAINNLFNRINGKSKARSDESDSKIAPSSNPVAAKILLADTVSNSDPVTVRTGPANTERNISEKLNVIQDTIIDMSAVVQKVEQFLAKERDKGRT